MQNIWDGKNASILKYQDLQLKLRLINSHYEIYKRWGQLTIWTRLACLQWCSGVKDCSQSESVDRNLLEISTEWPKRGKPFHHLMVNFCNFTNLAVFKIKMLRQGKNRSQELRLAKPAFKRTSFKL